MKTFEELVNKNLNEVFDDKTYKMLIQTLSIQFKKNGYDWLSQKAEYISKNHKDAIKYLKKFRKETESIAYKIIQDVKHGINNQH